jgi:hypothetical protein
MPADGINHNSQNLISAFYSKLSSILLIKKDLFFFYLSLPMAINYQMEIIQTTTCVDEEK